MRSLMVAVLACWSSLGLAQTTVTISATEDNSMFSENGSLSNGAGDFLFVGRTNNGTLRRALLRFNNLSAIPAGATITGVELVLEMSRTRVSSFDVSVHEVTADWGEAGSNASNQEGGGAAAQTGDATWTHRMAPDQTWSIDGGDFVSTSVTSASIGGNGEYVFASTASLIALVNDWLTNPTQNFGVLLLANENSTSAKRFNSRENASSPPQLRVTFEGGGATINPSGLWFNPSLPGDGFNVINSTSGSGDLLTFFFFGYSDNGQRLWLISESTTATATIGQTITVDMFDGPLNEGTFATPPTSGLLTWGTLDITFTSCTTADYELNGVDGIKTADLELLASLVGLDCDDTAVVLDAE